MKTTSQKECNDAAAPTFCVGVSRDSPTVQNLSLWSLQCVGHYFVLKKGRHKECACRWVVPNVGGV